MSGTATSNYSELFRAGKIGSLNLKNRLIMAPMGNALADDKGYVTDALLSYYRARAKGGVGLITTQFVSINQEDMMPLTRMILSQRANQFAYE